MQKKIFLLFAVLWAITLPAWAMQSLVQPIGEHGSIDWGRQVVTATGMGVPPANAINAAQGRAMAQRAAVVIARRNLLEVVKGVKITSLTTVANYIVQDDKISNSIKGVLNYSTVDKITPYSDGSYLAQVSMPLQGQLGNILVDLGEDQTQSSQVVSESGLEQRVRALEQKVYNLEQRLSSFKRVQAQQEQFNIYLLQSMQNMLTPQLSYIAYNDSNSIKQIQQQQANILYQLKNISQRLTALEKSDSKGMTKAAKTSYTGLVIDARNIGFSPCMRPSIFASSDKLYPYPGFNRAVAARSGYVRYFRNLGQAQRSSNAGSLPYTIKANSLYQRRSGSILLRGDKAQELAKILKQKPQFITQAKVVIVF